MRKLTLLIIIACLFLVASKPPFFEGSDYRVYVEKSAANFDYKANDFYSVYYVYMNVIRVLDINDRLGERDIEKVISLIVNNLKKRNVVQLQIDNYKGTGTLRVTLRSDLTPKDSKPALWIISNFNAQTKRIVSGDAEKDAYATFLFLVGDKLVKYQRITEPKKESELKKLSVNSRADYYLLDGDPGNDALGKDLLEKEVKKPGEMPDRPLLYMTLSEYHLLSGDVKTAKQCLDKSQSLIDSIKDEKRKSGLLHVLRYAKDLYKYYVAYRSRS